MTEESVLYTRDQLEDLDRKINFMVNGQGFSVCVIDTKHTRRRTLVNQLKKIGVESITEAESYEKALPVMKKHAQNSQLIITDLEVGKLNGLRLITNMMSSFKGVCGVILSDARIPKLEQVSKVTKAITCAVRPLDEDGLKELILGFGFSLEKP